MYFSFNFYTGILLYIERCSRHLVLKFFFFFRRGGNILFSTCKFEEKARTNSPVICLFIVEKTTTYLPYFDNFTYKIMDKAGSTYRIQFNKNFNFQQFERIIAYLDELGIGTVYASPILSATPGSIHGYDGTDVHTLNPELGTIAQLEQLKKQLAEVNIKWLQDIVPNHLAYHHDNGWLMDVLEYGELSTYRTYFDTPYSSSLFEKGKLMVPILGKGLSETIEAGEIKITFENQRLYLTYFDHQLPISPASYDNIFGVLDSTTDGTALQERLADMNNSGEKIADILSKQHYQLCHWKETNERINYRRFFTINGLICLNVHEEEVFEDAHVLVGDLLSKQIVDGFRIDHIDGLYNPAKYLRDLRKLCGPDTYIVVEKILEQEEALPLDWPVQGTTGYDFLALCNNVCTDQRSEKALTRFYEELTGDHRPIVDQQAQKKEAILTQHMQGEIDNLCRLFLSLKLDREEESLDVENLQNAIQAFLVYFPVYRLYEESFPFHTEAYTTVMAVFDTVLQKMPGYKIGIDRLRKSIEHAQHTSDLPYRQKAMIFFLRCMQFTGPVMAKGVEDTLMYTYNRFIGHNEVGDHPAYFGITIPAFHEAMQHRQAHWPTTLNATATHDTKRGEDVRSRLQVLTAWPEAWMEEIGHWQKIIEEKYAGALPHIHTIYFIYQSMLGSYPMPHAPDDGFKERFLDYLTKYLREGKEHSDWDTPNLAYEKTVGHFATFLLDESGPFFPVFQAFLDRIADFGIINSFVQLTLKYTCPGIPDTYQGTELWDLSFVDPDNRRPVDYAIRQQYLQEINQLPPDRLLASLWEERHHGKIKLWLIKTLLAIRKKYPELFNDGEYIPLAVKGKYQQHVLAYARKQQQEWLVVVVPLHLAAIEKLRDKDARHLDWEDTHVVLPHELPVYWQHELCPMRGEGTTLPISTIFKEIPLAVVYYHAPSNARSAGILMHITSLHTAFGIGDLGPGAYSFVRFLHAARQRWWQVLPLGPTSHQQGYSPYSTRSALAGNPLLISLEVLANENLLTQAELEKAQADASVAINFLQVESIKQQALNFAFKRADLNDPAFETFCAEEKYWLDDYALFVVLQRTYSGAPWYAWPDPFRSRDPEVLTSFESEHRSQILKEKWIQYIFFCQWKKLKRYSLERGVYMLGDVPIYVGHDSADVWAHPQLFSLNADGSLRSVAGVPPDYFNADGQLWGMPVYDWQAVKEDSYRWWIARLAHNCKLFDRVRLDHFRAFAAYWEIPAGEETAKNGKWKPGPGKDFFDKIQTALGKLPFVAEDLGDIDDAVYELRDAFHLPGIKVLQFAFGDDMATSPHIPHHYGRNFVAYTGTHDNNTTVGWFEEELDGSAKDQLAQYASVAANKKNISGILMKMVYASVADTVIVPLQDLLALPGSHRMNSPATTTGNWTWIASPDACTDDLANKLRHYMELYGRT